MILRDTNVSENEAKFILYRACDGIWDCDEVTSFDSKDGFANIVGTNNTYMCITGLNNARRKRAELNGFVISGDEFDKEV